MIARGLRAIALGVLMSAGCASHVITEAPPPAPVVPPVAAAPTPLEGLAAALDDVLAHRPFARASTALVVRSLDTGETLYRRNGATWLVPASTQKILTVAAAAGRLGWDFRFETRLLAAGPITDGVLHGDLVVVGSGDPTMNRRHPGRTEAFDEWATTLQARGIRRVTGRLIGDDGGVEQPAWGIGWAWDDLFEGYGAPYSALQFNENEIEVQVGPGITPGAPAIVALAPAQHDLLVENHAVTAAAGAAADVSILRVPGTRFLRVSGQVPLAGQARTLVTTVANAALLYAGELRSVLERHGITVDGGVADLDEVAPAPDLRGAGVLLVDLSPPLREIADPLLKWSRNIYAEALLMALDPTPPAGAAEGLDVLRTTLASLGVDPSTYSTRDGSGLSRNDYLSADALVATLTAMWQRPDLREPFVAALPQAGKSGSLYSRLRGTPAEGLVWAKTGSMSNVRSLAGYIQTAAGSSLAFAFLCNGFDVPAADIDAEVDRLLLALSAAPR